MLSDAARSVWAKSNPGDDGWMPLDQHLQDTAAVAGLLWDRWLSENVKRQVSTAAGATGDGRALLVWLAGVHDIGKATPAFAVQVEATAPHLTARMRDAGLAMRSVLADRRLVRHELAGQHLLTRWLRERHGWRRTVADTYAVVVGGHHGAPPEKQALALAADRTDLVGEGLWTSVQDELLEHMSSVTSASAYLRAWSEHALPYPTQVLLTAAVIIADWLASNPDLFRLGTPGGSDERAAAAWEALELPAQWSPQPPPTDAEHLFAARFALPSGSTPRPVQRAAVELARSTDLPGLLVIEAPMGSGKTEAALAAAEVLAHRVGAGGVFVALPTMATSDAMFNRVLRWVEQLPSSAVSPDVTVFLAHGKAALNPEMRSLRPSRGPVGVADDEDRAGAAEQQAVAVAHAWLRGRKKGPLSSFVVGTIDQVLFAGLRSKHLALRHLALAGKVVVIDEVHAVDAYMSSYLQRVLHWLGAYGVPTVLLSATLPAAQRRALVAAYDEGRARAAGRAPDPERHRVLGDPAGYPLVTATTAAAPHMRTVEHDGGSVEVALQRLADDDALVTALREALADGGCAAVVRNTVGRAQATYDLLRERLDGEVLLLHSRFVAVDRAARERDLVERLGPAAGERRPKRLVVVGTQVIEQSLDIDFDLMVTDLAPVDLVLQRLGRLHRHPRGDAQDERPPRLRRPRCLVTGVDDWEAQPPTPISGSQAVYRQAPLLRSLAVLVPVLDRGHLVLPDDIEPLVQRAYAEDLRPPTGWEEAFTTAEQKQRSHETDQQKRSRDFQLGPVKRPGESLLDWVTASAGEADDSGRGQAQVRDSEDGVEVVVVQRVAGEVRLLPWATEHAGRVVPIDGRPSDDVARAVATCTLRLPVQLTHPGVVDAVLRALERAWYSGWQDSPWLSGQLVLELDETSNARLAGHHLHYDRERGLLVSAAEEES